MSASLSSTYVPKRGDVVWLDFDPQKGHEQANRRPALVLSPDPYNGLVGLALVCPITNQIKKLPFEVVIPSGFKVSGAILSDQLKSLDWKARNAVFLCQLPLAIIADVLAKIHPLLY